MKKYDAAFFASLSSAQKRAMHFHLCAAALETWNQFTSERPVISYVESVCGTQQTVDRGLPARAFASAESGRDADGIADRYLEPLSAMQDDDLVFPDRIEDAYYAVYNLFRKYACAEAIDDWLIINQALAAGADDTIRERFEAAVTEALKVV